MAYPICCKFPAHPPADGSSPLRVQPTLFGFNVTVCALLLPVAPLHLVPGLKSTSDEPLHNPRIVGTIDETNALNTITNFRALEPLTKPTHMQHLSEILELHGVVAITKTRVICIHKTMPYIQTSMKNLYWSSKKLNTKERF
jgi:hypothetical protein